MNPSRTVLIVTSAYAPAMAADMHRARMLAWHLPALGWRVEVLAPGEGFQPPACVEPDGASFFAPSTPTHAALPWMPRLFRRLGLRSIGWRALVPLAVAGMRLLRSRRVDLVYITTTQFNIFLLGPLWRRLTGTPFVLDLHDPPYVERPRYRTTSHQVKSAIARRLAKRIERLALTAADGVVSVSPHYLEALRRRYADTPPSWVLAGRESVIPFGARIEDLAATAQRAVAEPGRKLHIVYVGAGGVIMERALLQLCRGLRLLRQRGDPLVARLRIELHGTVFGWQEGGEKPMQRVAASWGLSDVLAEYPSRVSYRRSLELLQQADGVLVLGVDDAGYMPSKLFGYALSGKPLLAALHADGPARKFFDGVPEPLGQLLWFGDGSEMPVEEAALVVSAFLQEVAAGKRYDRRRVLEPVLAPAMAFRHAQLFERCLGV